jgi:hypothetical protein
MSDLSYSFPPPKSVMPPELQDLLLEEGETVQGTNESALGTGIVAIISTARGGKTTLGYGMIDWAIAHTNRPIILASFPQIVLDEGIPEHWHGRVRSMKPEEIHEIGQDEPAIWLMDDAAANFNSRSSMRSGQVQFSRSAGIISHLGGGQTIIFTSQSANGVDLSFFRYTEVVQVVRYMSKVGLKTERSGWSDDIDHAQWLLKLAHGPEGSRRLRDYYITISHGKGRGESPYRVVPYVKPKWLFETMPKRQRDMLSRPFRYMDKKDLTSILTGKPPPKKRGRPKKEENE